MGTTLEIGAGLAEPVFCPENVSDPFDTVTWEQRDVVIRDKDGNVLFEQRGVESPSSWSQDAVQTAVSKYFYGLMGTAQRETSIRQLIHRVTRTIADWGCEDGHFDTEEREQFYRDLTWLCLHQHIAFNSPVWFNVGLHSVYGVKSGGGSLGYRFNPATRTVAEVDPMVHPQGSACFIIKMIDSIDSIWDAAKDSARLFKFGSGVGMDLSPLRSKHEPLSGGGKASGPISFGRIIDCTGGTIKSGGRTRRAAIMLTLKCWHPEIWDFLVLKSDEELKAKALIAAGYEADFNGPAYSTVGFQNANISARLTNAFMKTALMNGTWHTRWVTDRNKTGPSYPAADMLRKIAEGTWLCGDPGVQFEDAIQKWHTCPNTEPINSSNPCSEFMFLDDTSCNLASLRLTKFRRIDGTINVADYKKAIRAVFRAQEILVGNVSYPTKAIAERSYKFRPIGIGYADLGALIMLHGVPYDSDAGRSLCGAMTAIMTGEAYLESAKIAEKLGAFEGYAENKEPMLDVMRMHRAAISKIQSDCPKYLIDAAKLSWDNAIQLGESHGYRNSQASVLAPTGTISFMMDCATTGIEPELALVKYKLLAGGGNMKIDNPIVDDALVVLGYDKPSRNRILKYIIDKGGTEGCGDIKTEHAAVFDTSFPMCGGKRVIHWKAHIDMMAAAQPFISGAISKTVNLPEEATVTEIHEALVDAWRKELKAVAMYRDKSKWSQPLSTSKDGNSVAAVIPWGTRKKLPNPRVALTYSFAVGGQEGYIKTGFYEDGSVGEVFLQMNQGGSTMDGLMKTIGMAISFALQHGASLEFICDKLAYMDFEPRGFTGDRDVPSAKSVVDYLARWLKNRFVKKAEPAPISIIKNDTDPVLIPTHDGRVVTGPPCQTCGSMTIRNGPCFFCRNCQSSTGGCG